MMPLPSWRRSLPVSLVALVLCGLAACGGSPTGVQNVQSAVPVQVSSPKPTVAQPRTTPSSPATGVSSSQTGQIVATASTGDKVLVKLSFSPLMTPANVGGAAASCQLDMSRALVVRMVASVTVESSLATAVSIIWNPTIDYAPVNDVTGFYLVSDYSSGRSCSQVDLAGNEQVNWPSVSAGTTVQFTGYWIFSQTISPAHPNGDLQGLGEILLEPVVLLSQSPASVVYSGDRHVLCVQSGGLASEDGFYLAGNRPHRLVVGGMSADLICHP